MSENAGFRIEGITEVGRLGDRVDRILRTGQEVPASRRFWPAVVRQCRLLVLRRHVRRFARVETDENHVVLAAGVERKHLQLSDYGLLHLIAQHWAAVVHESQKYWPLLTEIVS